MKETINKVVENIRKISEMIKSNAEGASEKAIEDLKKVKAPIEAYTAVTRALLVSLVTVGEGLRTITEGGAATKATRKLIKHIIVDYGSRLNEFGNVVQALGQDDKFLGSLNDSQKAWEKAVNLVATLDAEDEDSFHPGERVMAGTMFFVLGRANPPEGLKGVVEEVYKPGEVDFKEWKEMRRDARMFLGKKALKKAQVVLVKWDDYTPENEHDEVVGSSFVLVPLDKLHHLIEDGADNDNDVSIN